MFQVVGKKVGTREVSAAFGKQVGNNKMIQGGFSELGFMCGVACYSGHMLIRL